MNSLIDNDLVYKDNEAPALLLEEDYRDFKGHDFEILGNMLTGLPQANIKNIIIKSMSPQALTGMSEYILSKISAGIVWRITYEDLLKIYEERRELPSCVKLVLRIEENMTNECLNSVDFLNTLCEKINEINRTYYKISAMIINLNTNHLVHVEELLLNVYNRTQITLTLNPVLDANNGLHITWAQLDHLYRISIEINNNYENRTAVLMELGILPARLLNEHPCNGYVCFKHTCHSSKGDVPRRLAIMRNGKVYPERKQADPNLLIGDLAENTLENMLISYKDSESHELFKQISKAVHIKWVQTSPFRVVPWGHLFSEEAKYADRTTEASV